MENFHHFSPKWLDIAVDAAYEAGKVLKKYWGNLKEINHKSSSSDLVTEADKKSEQIILKILAKNFPGHRILAEESGLNNQISDFIWMVDPLDGTTNYTHQYPMVAVSIGLLYRQHSILGVIYNPIIEELFTGVKGLGAKLNGFPIHVSQVSSLNKSLLATGFSYDRSIRNDNNYVEFCHLTNLTQGVRRGGAAALDLAYVACGRLDGYWELGLKAWDIAAGAIIVSEAGGEVTDYDLSPLDFYSGRVLASNSHLHKIMSEKLFFKT